MFHLCSFCCLIAAIGHSDTQNILSHNSATYTLSQHLLFVNSLLKINFCVCNRDAQSSFWDPLYNVERQAGGAEILPRHAHSGHFNPGKSALTSVTPKACVTPVRQARIEAPCVPLVLKSISAPACQSTLQKRSQKLLFSSRLMSEELIFSCTSYTIIGSLFHSERQLYVDSLFSERS